MKKLVVLLMLSASLVSGLKADEGMWVAGLLQKFNIGEMTEMGMKITAEDIYSVNQSSIKDAIVIFGRGCTASIISDQGLVLTNHHCGYEWIQGHSSVEHDYLTDGFWAQSFEEELPTPGLKVRFLVRMEDVTTKVTKKVKSDMTEDERDEKIEEAIEKIKEAAEKEGDFYEATVKSFFGGNEYYLFVYEVYNDVRMVGTPPSSIGKFGADTDNWMWPRHTADFSLFRVYTSPDGKPAEYSADNVAMKPRHHLPVSLKGVEDADFTMVLGFPGRTNRYLTSFGIDERMNIINKTLIDIAGAKHDVWIKGMKADKKVNIQYATKYAHSANSWKVSKGMNRGLERLRVLDRKRALESDFQQWADQPAHEKYKNVLKELKEAYATKADYAAAASALANSFYRGAEIVGIARKANDLKKAFEEKKSSKEIEEAKEKLTEELKKSYKDYAPELDQELLPVMLEEYKEHVASQFLPATYERIGKDFGGDYTKFAADLFKKSLFANEGRFKSTINNITLDELTNDPAFVLVQELSDQREKVGGSTKEYDATIKKNNRLFIAGLREMKPGGRFYPDANQTMRVTYGPVGGYEPQDGVKYKYYTTYNGILEKYIPGDYEFDVSEKLRDLLNKKDFGQYADKDGVLRTCFVASSDFTGGSSGSPVLNANGEIFGLAFDITWEGTSGDIAFEPELQKGVHADIRYVLFVIDKFAGATRLIDEMTLVR